MGDKLLIAMRLIDMRRMHPSQDNSHRCVQCDAPVGVYPSGQRALRDDPELEILCSRCAKPGIGDIQMPAARSLEEIVQESRDSFDVKKA